MIELKRNHNLKNIYKESLQCFGVICISIAISLLLQRYVVFTVHGKGTSMLPTLHNDDIICVEKISLYRKSIKRGQLICFDSHTEKSFYVKRVIGIAGDEITIKEGKVYLNGIQLKEDYLAPNEITNVALPINKYKVTEGYVFVLGDNRDDSLDSRIIGPIKTDDIRGPVFFRIFPINRMQFFK